MKKVSLCFVSKRRDNSEAKRARLSSDHLNIPKFTDRKSFSFVILIIGRLGPELV